MNVKIEESWRKRLQEEFDKPYFEQLVTFVKNEYRSAHVLPPGHQIFHIFNACPFEKVKVVILGQDPYPNPGQYYGVCFSVPQGVPIPGSLANIFKEIHQDLGKPIPTSGNLDRWVEQGVFPMNSVLTVRAHETGSHRNMGWETFTDAVIKKLSDGRENLVFMLWGSYAKEKIALIDTHKHLVLTTVHPSHALLTMVSSAANTSARRILSFKAKVFKRLIGKKYEFRTSGCSHSGHPDVESGNIQV